MFPLKDKVVIITGASSGIGRATAHAFAAHGSRIVLVARRAHLLEEVQKELAQHGNRSTLSVPTDIVIEDDLQNLYNIVIREFGTIDVLVNNAGVAVGGAFQHQDYDQVRKMVEINVFAPMRLTQLVLPLMLERNQGHIVNVGSMAGLMHSPGQTSYAPTRSAIISFSHVLRREIAGSKVRVSLVLPGLTRTAMLEKMDVDEMRKSKILMPFTNLDDPSVPANAIVNAVIKNRLQVPLGGIQYLLGDFLHRLSPRAMDWFYRVFMHTDKVVQVMKNLG
jgi:short-subunit dehydrogenase